MKHRKELLNAAEQIVCADRETQYGSPEDNFATIAGFWSAYLDKTLSAKDVAVMMCLFKIGRIKTGQHKADNYIDLIGYAACAGEVSAIEEQR